MSEYPEPKPVPVAALYELLDAYRDVVIPHTTSRAMEMWLALAQLVGAYEEEARLQVEGQGVPGRFLCAQCEKWKTPDDFFEEDDGNGPVLGEICRDCWERAS